MKNIWKKIEIFFINWFWWRWRAMKYDRDTNSGRKDAIKFVREMRLKGHYIYIGFGTALRFFRDGTMKNQDLDIIISKEAIESRDFEVLIKKYNLEKWNDIYFDGILRISKYLLRKKVPFEFFITENNNDTETTFHTLEKVAYNRVLPIQLLKEYNSDEGIIILPKNLRKYSYDNYGENYMKRVKNFNFTKQSNLDTLHKINQEVTYKEYKWKQQ